MQDILQEDALSNPNSPVDTHYFPSINLCETSAVDVHVKLSLTDEMNKLSVHCQSNSSSTSDLDFSYSDAKTSSVAATPSRSRVWCISREACMSASPKNSP